MRLRHAAVLAALLPAASFAQDAVEPDSPEGRIMIAAASHTAGDCLAAAEGEEMPDAAALSVRCDAPDATHRVESVVVDPAECPDGAEALPEGGPEKATFCLAGIGR